MLKKFSSLMFALLLMISCPFLLTACKKDKDKGSGGGGGDDTPSTPTIESIEVLGEIKDTYFVGDELDITGIQVKITKSDDSTETIDLVAEMISGFDTTTAGEKTLTVTYEEETATVVYYVVEPKVSSIAVKEGTLKTNYFVGDPIALATAKLVVTYENSKTEEVAITDAMLSGFNSATAGTNKELTITYAEKTVKVKYNITAIVATKITLESPITKSTYFEGETLKVDGGKIKVYYNNETTKSVNITANMVSGFDSTTPRSATMTITYEGKSCTQSYTIKAIELTGISLTKPFTKTEYFEGETFKVDGGKITLTYNNGDTNEIAVTASMISGYNSAVPGENKTLTITHEGKTTTATYTIIEIVATQIVIDETFKTEYFVDEPLDLTGGVITVYFNNNTQKTINLDEADNGVTITGFNEQTPTTAQMRISYEEAEFFVNYTIKAVIEQSIRLSSNFDKMTYHIGDNYDPTGGKIEVTYNNGDVKFEDITVDMLETKTASTVGTKTITISTFYLNPNQNPNDATDDFLKTTITGITVNYKSMVLSSPFTKTVYMVGDELDVSGAQITITYYSGFYAEPNEIEKTKTLDVDASMIKYFNTDYVGNKLFTIEYQGLSLPSIAYEVKTTIESIRLTSNFKLDYFTGEELDLTGGVITIVYNDGTPTATIDLSVENDDVVISGFSTERATNNSLTITYKGMIVSQIYNDPQSGQSTRTAIPYTVTALQVTSIEEDESSTMKKAYLVGEALDLTGAKLKVNYSNGTSAVIDITEEMLDTTGAYKFDSAFANDTTYPYFELKVVYENQPLIIQYTVSYPA